MKPETIARLYLIAASRIKGAPGVAASNYFAAALANQTIDGSQDIGLLKLAFRAFRMAVASGRIGPPSDWREYPYAYCAACSARLPEHSHRYCGTRVCDRCGYHAGLERCFCGWAADGRDGRAELIEAGETIDPE